MPNLFAPNNSALVTSRETETNKNAVDFSSKYEQIREKPASKCTPIQHPPHSIHSTTLNAEEPQLEASKQSKAHRPKTTLQRKAIPPQLFPFFSAGGP